LPGDAERRSPAPSAAGPGARLPTDTPSRYATGGRLTMRAGDAAILRRLAHHSGAGNSGGSGGSAGGGGSGTNNQPADAMPLTQQRSQMNVV